MPQLDPNPWFTFFILTIIALFILLPMKISKFPQLGTPKMYRDRYFMKLAGTTWPIKKEWTLQW